MNADKAALLLLLASLAHAQIAASISGQVKDPSGAVVRDAVLRGCRKLWAHSDCDAYDRHRYCRRKSVETFPGATRGRHADTFDEDDDIGEREDPRSRCAEVTTYGPRSFVMMRMCR